MAEDRVSGVVPVANRSLDREHPLATIASVKWGEVRPSRSMMASERRTIQQPSGDHELRKWNSSCLGRRI